MLEAAGLSFEVVPADVDEASREAQLCRRASQARLRRSPMPWPAPRRRPSAPGIPMPLSSAPTRFWLSATSCSTSPATSPRRARNSSACAAKPTACSRPWRWHRAGKSCGPTSEKPCLTMRRFSPDFLDRYLAEAGADLCQHRRRLRDRRAGHPALRARRGRPLHHHRPAAGAAAGGAQGARSDRHMKRACVIGWPVSHSRSPLIHGYWLQRYGIDGSYVRHPVAAGRCRRFPAHHARRRASPAATSRCPTRKRPLRPRPKRGRPRVLPAPPIRCGSRATS